MLKPLSHPSLTAFYRLASGCTFLISVAQAQRASARFSPLQASAHAVQTAVWVCNRHFSNLPDGLSPFALGEWDGFQVAWGGIWKPAWGPLGYVSSSCNLTQHFNRDNTQWGHQFAVGGKCAGLQWGVKCAQGLGAVGMPPEAGPPFFRRYAFLVGGRLPGDGHWSMQFQSGYRPSLQWVIPMGSYVTLRIIQRDNGSLPGIRFRIRLPWLPQERSKTTEYLESFVPIVPGQKHSGPSSLSRLQATLAGSSNGESCPTNDGSDFSRASHERADGSPSPRAFSEESQSTRYSTAGSESEAVSCIDTPVFAAPEARYLPQYKSSERGFPVLNVARPNARGVSFNILQEESSARLLTFLQAPQEAQRTGSTPMTSGLVLNHTAQSTQTALGRVAGNSRFKRKHQAKKIVLIWPKAQCDRLRQMAGQLVVAGMPAQVIFSYPGDMRIDGLVTDNVCALGMITGTVLPDACAQPVHPLGNLVITEKGIWDRRDYQAYQKREALETACEAGQPDLKSLVDAKPASSDPLVLRLQMLQLLAKNCTLSGPLLANSRQFLLGEQVRFLTLGREETPFFERRRRPIDSNLVDPMVGTNVTLQLANDPFRPHRGLALSPFCVRIPLHIQKREAYLAFAHFVLTHQSELAITQPYGVPGRLTLGSPFLTVRRTASLSAAELLLHGESELLLAGSCYFDTYAHLKSKKWCLDTSRETAEQGNADLPHSGYLGLSNSAAAGDLAGVTALLEVDEAHIAQGTTCAMPTTRLKGDTEPWADTLLIEGLLAWNGAFHCDSRQINLKGKWMGRSGPLHVRASHINSGVGSLLWVENALFLNALAPDKVLRVIVEGIWQVPQLIFLGTTALHGSPQGCLVVQNLKVDKNAQVTLQRDPTDPPWSLALHRLDLEPGSTLQSPAGLRLVSDPTVTGTALRLGGQLSTSTLQVSTPVQIEQEQHLKAEQVRLTPEGILTFTHCAPVLHSLLSIQSGGKLDYFVENHGTPFDQWVLAQSEIPTPVAEGISQFRLLGDLCLLDDLILPANHLILESGRCCTAEGNLTVVSQNIEVQAGARLKVNGRCRFEQSCTVACWGEWEAQAVEVAKDVIVTLSGCATAFKGVQNWVVESGGHCCTAEGQEITFASEKITLDTDARWQLKGACRFEKSCDVVCLGEFEAKKLTVASGVTVTLSGVLTAFEGLQGESQSLCSAERHRITVEEDDVMWGSKQVVLEVGSALRVKGQCRLKNACQVTCLGQFQADVLVIDSQANVTWSGESQAFENVKYLVLEPGAQMEGGDGVQRIAATGVFISDAANLFVAGQPPIIGKPSRQGPDQYLICESQLQSWRVQGMLKVPGTAMVFKQLCLDEAACLESTADGEVRWIGEAMRLGASARCNAKQLSLAIHKVMLEPNSQLKASQALTFNSPVASTLEAHQAMIETPILTFQGKGHWKRLQDSRCRVCPSTWAEDTVTTCTMCNVCSTWVVETFHTDCNSQLCLESFDIVADHIRLKGRVAPIHTRFFAKTSFELGQGDSGSLLHATIGASTDVNAEGGRCDCHVASPIVILHRHTKVTCGQFTVKGMDKERANRLCTEGELDCQRVAIEAVYWDQLGNVKVQATRREFWCKVDHFRQFTRNANQQLPKLVVAMDQWAWEGKTFKAEAGLIDWQTQAADLMADAFHAGASLKSSGVVSLTVPVDNITGGVGNGKEKLTELHLKDRSQAVSIETLKQLAGWCEKLVVNLPELSGVSAGTCTAPCLETALELRFGHCAYTHAIDLRAKSLALYSDQAIVLQPHSALKTCPSVEGNGTGKILVCARSIALQAQAELSSSGGVQLEASEQLKSSGANITAQKSIGLKALQLTLENETQISLARGPHPPQSNQAVLFIQAGELNIHASILRSWGDLKIQVNGINGNTHCTDSTLIALQALLLSSCSGRFAFEEMRLSAGRSLRIERQTVSQSLADVALIWSASHFLAGETLQLHLPNSVLTLQAGCTLTSTQKLDVRLKNLSITNDSVVLSFQGEVHVDQQLLNYGKLTGKQSLMVYAGAEIKNVWPGKIYGDALVRLVAPTLTNDSDVKLSCSDHQRLDGMRSPAFIFSRGGSGGAFPGGLQCFTRTLNNQNEAEIWTVASDTASTDLCSTQDLWILPYELAATFEQTIQTLRQGDRDHYTFRNLLKNWAKQLDKLDKEKKRSPASLLNSAARIHSARDAILLLDEIENQDPGLEVDFSQETQVEHYYEYSRGGETHCVLNGDQIPASSEDVDRNALVGKMETSNRTGVRELRVRKGGVTVDDGIREFKAYQKRTVVNHKVLISSRAAVLESMCDLWVCARNKIKNSALFRSKSGASSVHFFDFSNEEKSDTVWLENAAKQRKLKKSSVYTQGRRYYNQEHSNRAREFDRSANVAICTIWSVVSTCVAIGAAVGTGGLGGVLMGGVHAFVSGVSGRMAAEDMQIDIPPYLYTPQSETLSESKKDNPEEDLGLFADEERLQHLQNNDLGFMGQSVHLGENVQQVLKQHSEHLLQSSEALNRQIATQIQATPIENRLIPAEQAAYALALKNFERFIRLMFCAHRVIPESVTAQAQMLWGEVRKETLWNPSLLACLLELCQTTRSPSITKNALRNLLQLSSDASPQQQISIGTIESSPSASHALLWEAFLWAIETESEAFQDAFANAIQTVTVRSPAYMRGVRDNTQVVASLKSEGFSDFCDVALMLLLGHPDWKKSALLNQHQLVHCHQADIFQCWRCAFEMLSVFLLRSLPTQTSAVQQLLAYIRVLIQRVDQPEERTFSVAQLLLSQDGSADPSHPEAMHDWLHYLCEPECAWVPGSLTGNSAESFSALAHQFLARYEKKQRGCRHAAPETQKVFFPYQCALGRIDAPVIDVAQHINAQLEQFAPVTTGDGPVCDCAALQTRIRITLPKTFGVSLSFPSESSITQVALQLTWPVAGSLSGGGTYELVSAVLMIPNAPVQIRKLETADFDPNEKCEVYGFFCGEKRVSYYISAQNRLNFRVLQEKVQVQCGQPDPQTSFTILADELFIKDALPVGWYALYGLKGDERERIVKCQRNQLGPTIQKYAKPPAPACAQATASSAVAQKPAQRLQDFFDLIPNPEETFQRSWVYRRYRVELQMTTKLAQGLKDTANEVVHLNPRWIEPGIEQHLKAMLDAGTMHSLFGAHGEQLWTEEEARALTSVLCQQSLELQEEFVQWFRNQIAPAMISGGNLIEMETRGTVENRAIIQSRKEVKIEANKVLSAGGLWSVVKSLVVKAQNTLAFRGRTKVLAEEIALESKEGRVECIDGTELWAQNSAVLRGKDVNLSGRSHDPEIQADMEAAGAGSHAPSHASAADDASRSGMSTEHLDGGEGSGTGITRHQSMQRRTAWRETQHESSCSPSARSGGMVGAGQQMIIQAPGGTVTLSDATGAGVVYQGARCQRLTKELAAQKEQEAQKKKEIQEKQAAQKKQEAQKQEAQEKQEAQKPEAAQTQPMPPLNEGECLEEVCNIDEQVQKAQQAHEEMVNQTQTRPGESVHERFRHHTEHHVSSLTLGNDLHLHVGKLPEPLHPEIVEETEGADSHTAAAAPVECGIQITAGQVVAHSAAETEYQMNQKEVYTEDKTFTFRTVLDNIYEACQDIFCHTRSQITQEERQALLMNLSDKDRTIVNGVIDEANHPKEPTHLEKWAAREPEAVLQAVGAAAYLGCLGCVAYACPLSLLANFTVRLDNFSEFLTTTQITVNRRVTGMATIRAEGQLDLKVSGALEGEGLKMTADSANISVGILNLKAAKSEWYTYFHQHATRRCENFGYDNLSLIFSGIGGVQFAFEEAKACFAQHVQPSMSKFETALQGNRPPRPQADAPPSNGKAWDPNTLPGQCLYQTPFSQNTPKENAPQLKQGDAWLEGDFRVGGNAHVNIEGEATFKTVQDAEFYEEIQRSRPQTQENCQINLQIIPKTKADILQFIQMAYTCRLPSAQGEQVEYRCFKERHAKKISGIFASKRMGYRSGKKTRLEGASILGGKAYAGQHTYQFGENGAEIQASSLINESTVEWIRKDGRCQYLPAVIPLHLDADTMKQVWNREFGPLILEACGEYLIHAAPELLKTMFPAAGPGDWEKFFETVEGDQTKALPRSCGTRLRSGISQVDGKAGGGFCAPKHNCFTDTQAPCIFQSVLADPERRAQFLGEKPLLSTRIRQAKSMIWNKRLAKLQKARHYFGQCVGMSTQILRNHRDAYQSNLKETHRYQPKGHLPSFWVANFAKQIFPKRKRVRGIDFALSSYAQYLISQRDQTAFFQKFGLLVCGELANEALRRYKDSPTFARILGPYSKAKAAFAERLMRSMLTTFLGENYTQLPCLYQIDSSLQEIEGLRAQYAEFVEEHDQYLEEAQKAYEEAEAQLKAQGASGDPQTSDSQRGENFEPSPEPEAVWCTVLATIQQAKATLQQHRDPNGSALGTLLHSSSSDDLMECKMQLDNAFAMVRAKLNFLEGVEKLIEDLRFQGIDAADNHFLPDAAYYLQACDDAHLRKTIVERIQMRRTDQVGRMRPFSDVLVCPIRDQQECHHNADLCADRIVNKFLSAREGIDPVIAKADDQAAQKELLNGIIEYANFAIGDQGFSEEQRKLICLTLKPRIAQALQTVLQKLKALPHVPDAFRRWQCVLTDASTELNLAQLHRSSPIRLLSTDEETLLEGTIFDPKSDDVRLLRRVQEDRALLQMVKRLHKEKRFKGMVLETAQVPEGNDVKDEWVVYHEDLANYLRQAYPHRAVYLVGAGEASKHPVPKPSQCPLSVEALAALTPEQLEQETGIKPWVHLEDYQKVALDLAMNPDPEASPALKVIRDTWIREIDWDNWLAWEAQKSEEIILIARAQCIVASAQSDEKIEKFETAQFYSTLWSKKGQKPSDEGLRAMLSMGTLVMTHGQDQGPIERLAASNHTDDPDRLYQQIRKQSVLAEQKMGEIACWRDWYHGLSPDAQDTVKLDLTYLFSGPSGLGSLISLALEKAGDKAVSYARLRWGQTDCRSGTQEGLVDSAIDSRPSPLQKIVATGLVSNPIQLLYQLLVLEGVEQFLAKKSANKKALGSLITAFQAIEQGAPCSREEMIRLNTEFTKILFQGDAHRADQFLAFGVHSPPPNAQIPITQMDFAQGWKFEFDAQGNLNPVVCTPTGASSFRIKQALKAVAVSIPSEGADPVQSIGQWQWKDDGLPLIVKGKTGAILDVGVNQHGQLRQLNSDWTNAYAQAIRTAQAAQSIGDTQQALDSTQRENALHNWKIGYIQSTGPTVVDMSVKQLKRQWLTVEGWKENFLPNISVGAMVALSFTPVAPVVPYISGMMLTGSLGWTAYNVHKAIAQYRQLACLPNVDPNLLLVARDNVTLQYSALVVQVVNLKVIRPAVRFALKPVVYVGIKAAKHAAGYAIGSILDHQGVQWEPEMVQHARTGQLIPMMARRTMLLGAIPISDLRTLPVGRMDSNQFASQRMVSFACFHFASNPELLQLFQHTQVEWTAPNTRRVTCSILAKCKKTGKVRWSISRQKSFCRKGPTPDWDPDTDPSAGGGLTAHYDPAAQRYFIFAEAQTRDSNLLSAKTATPVPISRQTRRIPISSPVLSEVPREMEDFGNQSQAGFVDTHLKVGNGVMIQRKWVTQSDQPIPTEQTVPPDVGLVAGQLEGQGMALFHTHPTSPAETAADWIEDSARMNQAAALLSAPAGGPTRSDARSGQPQQLLAESSEHQMACLGNLAASPHPKAIGSAEKRQVPTEVLSVHIPHMHPDIDDSRPLASLSPISVYDQTRLPAQAVANDGGEMGTDASLQAGDRDLYAQASASPDLTLPATRQEGKGIQFIVNQEKFVMIQYPFEPPDDWEAMRAQALRQDKPVIAIRSPGSFIATRERRLSREQRFQNLRRWQAYRNWRHVARPARIQCVQDQVYVLKTRYGQPRSVSMRSVKLQLTAKGGALSGGGPMGSGGEGGGATSGGGQQGGGGDDDGTGPSQRIIVVHRKMGQAGKPGLTQRAARRLTKKTFVPQPLKGHLRPDRTSPALARRTVRVSGAIRPRARKISNTKQAPRVTQGKENSSADTSISADGNADDPAGANQSKSDPATPIQAQLADRSEGLCRILTKETLREVHARWEERYQKLAVKFEELPALQARFEARFARLLTPPAMPSDPSRYWLWKNRLANLKLPEPVQEAFRSSARRFDVLHRALCTDRNCGCDRWLDPNQSSLSGCADFVQQIETTVNQLYKNALESIFQTLAGESDANFHTKKPEEIGQLVADAAQPYLAALKELICPLEEVFKGLRRTIDELDHAIKRKEQIVDQRGIGDLKTLNWAINREKLIRKECKKLAECIESSYALSRVRFSRLYTEAYDLLDKHAAVSKSETPPATNSEKEPLSQVDQVLQSEKKTPVSKPQTSPTNQTEKKQLSAADQAHQGFKAFRDRIWPQDEQVSYELRKALRQHVLDQKEAEEKGQSKKEESQQGNDGNFRPYEPRPTLLSGISKKSQRQLFQGLSGAKKPADIMVTRDVKHNKNGEVCLGEEVAIIQNPDDPHQWSRVDFAGFCRDQKVIGPHAHQEFYTLADLFRWALHPERQTMGKKRREKTLKRHVQHLYDPLNEVTHDWNAKNPKYKKWMRQLSKKEREVIKKGNFGAVGGHCEKPPRLENRGNSCYLNSDLECLVNDGQLLSNVKECFHAAADCQACQLGIPCFIGRFEQLLLKLPELNSENFVIPADYLQPVIDAIPHSWRSGNEQHCAAEVFTYWIQNHPALQKAFSGGPAWQCQCTTHPPFVEKRVSVFWTMTSDQRTNDFATELAQRLVQDSRPTVNCQECSSAHQLVAFEFPTLLHVQGACFPSCDGNIPSEMTVKIPGLPQASARYQLQSAVLYRGNGREGHYRSCVLKGGKWYICDDAQEPDDCDKAEFQEKIQPLLHEEATQLIYRVVEP